jgi:hypothetical protein
MVLTTTVLLPAVRLVQPDLTFVVLPPKKNLPSPPPPSPILVVSLL